MIQKYLDLFGLNMDFTQEQLKKAYRRKMKEVHPDHIIESGLSEEEANALSKECKDAYDVLTKYLENGKVDFSFNHPYEESNTFDVKSYRYKKLKEIGEMLKDIELIEIECYSIDEYLSKVDEATLGLSNSKTKKEVDDNYSNFMENYKIMLSILKRVFFANNNINADEVTEKLNYELPIKEFYDSLEELKAKYSRTYQIEIKLKNEVEKFKLYAYFNDLENAIDEIVKVIIQEVREKKLTNIDVLVNELVVSVNNLFKDYRVFIVRVNELLKECEKIKGQQALKFTERLMNIKNNFRGINDFTSTGLDGIEYEIKKEIEYQNKLVDVERVNSIVNKTYKAALDLHKEMNDNDLRFMDIYRYYLMLYNKVIDIKTNIDDFLTLENLSFVDYGKDMELLMSVIMKSSISQIFISKESFAKNNTSEPRVIFNAGSKIFMYLNSSKETCEKLFNLNDLKNYVNLKVFMKNAYYNGGSVVKDMTGERYLILYNIVNSDYALVLKENGSVDLVNIGFCEFDKNTSVNFDIEKFRDIKELERYICMTILMGSNKLDDDEVAIRKK